MTEAPEELAFLEKGFFPFNIELNDGGIISYKKPYSSGRQLNIIIEVSGMQSNVTVEIKDGQSILASISNDEVDSIAFQTWGDEQVIRIYLSDSNQDFLVYHNPEPRIFFGELP
ncbi:hypothetical protein [Marinicella rhabdoformis]|uniref:hypothetical protein n=1 Tax=Marinicella rhabdoformis TaxID=2580566 RepID=UPI0012AEB4F1|nr:hypothetical protein [Marinicella rhabdoformis]